MCLMLDDEAGDEAGQDMMRQAALIHSNNNDEAQAAYKPM